MGGLVTLLYCTFEPLAQADYIRSYVVEPFPICYRFYYRIRLEQLGSGPIVVCRRRITKEHSLSPLDLPEILRISRCPAGDLPASDFLGGFEPRAESFPRVNREFSSNPLPPFPEATTGGQKCLLKSLPL